MSTESVARARVKPSCVSKLANFFPDAAPCHIAVRLERLGSAETFSENTIIEYGTTREALFACTRPLEFAEKVRLRNSDSSLDVEAYVVAVQYHSDQTAVAARFVEDVANWIVKP